MISIRLAKLEEVNTLNEMISLSAKELSKNEYSESEINAAIRYVFGVDTELVNDKTYFVIEKNGEIAGCGGWSKRKTLFGGNQFFNREKVAELDPAKDAAKIRAFFIHPKFARLGLGTMLLKHCETQASLHGFTQLEMMATLTGAKLYEKSAYKPINEETVTLPDKTHLKFIRMRKNLKEYKPEEINPKHLTFADFRY